MRSTSAPNDAMQLTDSARIGLPTGGNKDYGSIWIPSTPLPHMLQLDALRAFAVLAVLTSHFSQGKFYALTRLIDLGGLGVRLFFVLSGFLITGILLRSKSYCEKDGLPVLHAFRQFYTRRILRIFPLFYLVLGLAAVLNIPPVRQTFAWHAAFLTNFYIFLHGFNHPTNHFWSLAVEEQFYLAWPWVILLVSRRRLCAVILVTIVVGPVFRLFFGLGTGSYATPYFPLSCLDTLGVGALLALRKDQIADPQSREYPFGKAGLLLGFVALAVFILLGFIHRGRIIGYAIFDVGAALLAGWVVLRASTGFRGPIGKLLEIKPLIYLGTISYGIYVYHQFIPYVMYKTLGLPSIVDLLALPYAWPLDSLLKGGVTVCVAALSWHYFERPINNLKRYFKYEGDRSPKKIVPSA
jgi:peptidoglycan/LPS O-acetylase OafA/YrhL